MAVSTTNAYSGPYTANGVTVAFPFTFTAPTAEEVEVRTVAADGVETVVDPDAYTVTLASAGGTVTFDTAPANGTELLILLDPLFTQDIEFEDGSAWLASPVNEQADRSAARDQFLKREADRAFKIPLVFENVVGKFPVVDAGGAVAWSTGTGADDGLRTDLAGLGGSALTRFDPAGTGATPRTAEAKMRDRYHAKDWGVVADGTTNDTTALQAAIDAVNVLGGGVLNLPAGTIKANAVLKSGVTIKGAGQSETIIIPAANDHVFKTATGTSTVRIGLSDLRITGDLAHTGKNGINLETTGVGNFVDTIHLKNLWIGNCASAGIYTGGTSTAGPFVQRMFCENVQSDTNNLYNLRISGAVIECSYKDCVFANTVTTTGDAKNILFDVISGAFAFQHTFINCIGGVPATVTAGNFAPFLYIGGGSNINFLGCNVEGSSPVVYLADAAEAEGFTYHGGKVAATANTTVLFDLGNCQKVSVRNCRIDIGGGFTVTNLFRLFGDNSAKARNLDIEHNSVNGTYTKYLADAASFFASVASGDLPLYRSQLSVRGEGGVADDLVNIATPSGVTTAGASCYGKRCTLTAFDTANPVTIKNTGNIALDGGTDFVLDGARKVIHLEYLRQTDKWTEIGRCA